MADFHQFGTASQAKLESCHPDLERVFKRALRMTPDAIDITIVWGWRSQAEQNGIDPRFTNARWPSSFHNTTDDDGLPLSDAVDFAPWITTRNGKKGIPWSDNNLFSWSRGSSSQPPRSRASGSPGEAISIGTARPRIKPSRISDTSSEHTRPAGRGRSSHDNKP